jgi:hypothetical protein
MRTHVEFFTLERKCSLLFCTIMAHIATLELDELQHDSPADYSTFFSDDVRQAIIYLKDFKIFTNSDGSLCLEKWPVFVGDPPSEIMVIQRIISHLLFTLRFLHTPGTPIIYRWISINAGIAMIVRSYSFAFQLVFHSLILSKVSFANSVRNGFTPIQLNAPFTFRKELYDLAFTFLRSANFFHSCHLDFHYILWMLGSHTYFSNSFLTVIDQNI